MSSNNKKGIVDSNDNVVIPIEFDNLLDIPFGVMTVCRGYYGLYSYHGKLLFPCTYEGFYNPYGRADLVDVADSVTKSLYLIKMDTTWVKLQSYDKEKYRLNDLRQPYFKKVKKGEILFCLYHIASKTYEKIYKLDDKNVWSDVSADAKLRVDINAYFNVDLEAPEDQ